MAPTSRKRKLEDNSNFALDLIATRFSLVLPEDFEDILALASELKPESPLQAFEFLNLRLVGPFELLLDSTANTDTQTWRFWADPPEVTTVAVDLCDGTHFAYFRDLPSQAPLGLVSASLGSNKFSLVASSMSALLHQKMQKSEISDLPAFRVAQSRLARVPKALLQVKSAALRLREAQVLGRTSNGLDVCVPFDKKRQTGYRELPVSKKELYAIFRAIKTGQEVEKHRKKLEEIFNWVNIGNDESDFGQGFELGQELFAADLPGDAQSLAFAKAAGIFLNNAYTLLGRDQWIPVLQAALEGRRLTAALQDKSGAPKAYLAVRDSGGANPGRPRTGAVL